MRGLGGHSSLSFPVNAGAPFSSPPGEQGPLLPALLPLHSSWGGCSLQPAQCRGLFPTTEALPGSLPLLPFVLPFQQLLLVRGTGGSWQGSSSPSWDAGCGHQLHPSQELAESQRGEHEASPLLPSKSTPNIHPLCQGLA